MMTRTLTLLLSACLAILLAACNTTPSFEADTDYDREFDFTEVTKINIQRPRRGESTASLLVSDMQINRIDDALAAELTSRGYELVPDADQADLLLSWHLVTQEKMDVRAYDSMSYYNCWRCGPPVSDISVREYTQGTLIVDLIDPSRYKSVWRGIVQSRMHPNASEQESANRRKEAARAIFSGFPPGAAPAT